jgi:type IV secretory pathway TraG/TraD family ATPase VirD4
MASTAFMPTIYRYPPLSALSYHKGGKHNWPHSCHTISRGVAWLINEGFAMESHDSRWIFYWTPTAVCIRGDVRDHQRYEVVEL